MLRFADPRHLASTGSLVSLGDEQLVVLVRRGDEFAFEELFDRHSAGVLSFCTRLLGSREEGEDALQHAFLAAYQAIVERGVEPRAFKPWLYKVARNRCLSVLRSTREVALLRDDESVAATQQTADRVEQRADVREVLSDIANLPEQQRAALLLSEVCALSHVQIAQVIDCPREKVKSLVFQARVSLSLDREARDTPCGRVREQVAGASPPWWSLGLRRHLKRCEGCREFAGEVGRRRQLIAIALPVAPAIGLKRSALAAVGGGPAGGGGAGGGGLVSGLAAKAASVSGASAGASGGTAFGGLSTAVLVKAACIVGASAGVTAVSLAGAGEPPRAQDSGRPTSTSEGGSDAAKLPSSLQAAAPWRDDGAPTLAGGRPSDRSSDASASTSQQSAGALPPSGMLPAAIKLLGDGNWYSALAPGRSSLHASRGGGETASEGSAPVSDPVTRAMEEPDHRVRGPQAKAPKHDRGLRANRGGTRLKPDHGGPRRKPDHDGPRPKPDHGGPRPKPDHAETTCEKGGGLFVDVNQLVYACVFALPNRRQRRDHARKICERSAGSFVDVTPLVYACVLPGGTLPDPFPALP